MAKWCNQNFSCRQAASLQQKGKKGSYPVLVFFSVQETIDYQIIYYGWQRISCDFRKKTQINLQALSTDVWNDGLGNKKRKPRMHKLKESHVFIIMMWRSGDVGHTLQLHKTKLQFQLRALLDQLVDQSL